MQLGQNAHGRVWAILVAFRFELELDIVGVRVSGRPSVVPHSPIKLEAQPLSCPEKSFSDRMQFDLGVLVQRLCKPTFRTQHVRAYLTTDAWRLPQRGRGADGGSSNNIFVMRRLDGR